MTEQPVAPPAYLPMPPLDEPAPIPEWQRLDPRSILTFPFAQGGPLLVVLVIAAAVGGAVEALLIRLGITVAVLVAFGAVHWWRFRYRVLAGRLETRSGLIGRTSKSINVDRIRGIEIEAKLAHRLAGVCAVRVEHPGAASGSRGRNRDSRDRIDAVSHIEGERLRTVLLHERDRVRSAVATGEGEAPAGTADQVLLRMPTRWLLYAPFSLRMLVLGPAAVLAVANALTESGALRRARIGALTGVGWSALLVGGVVVVLLTAVLSATITYWRWTVTAHADDFVITRGLLTCRVTAIERRRLRGVIVREPLAGRPFGAASLQVVLSGVTGSTTASLAPLGPRPALDEFGRTFVPDCTQPWRLHPAGARRRRWRRGAGVGLLPLVGAAIAAPFTLVLAVVLAVGAVVVAALGVLWGEASYRALGHCLDERVLAARHGVIVRHRESVDRGQPIGARVRQSVFARRAGVASIDVALVARGFTRISDLDATEVGQLIQMILPTAPRGN